MGCRARAEGFRTVGVLGSSLFPGLKLGKLCKG